MITVTREINPKRIADIVPHLVLPGGGTEGFVRQMAQMLEQQPDSLYIVQARKEDDTLVGFTVVHNVPFVDHTYVAQVWIAPGVGKRVGDEMLALAVLWTISLGKSVIRGYTSREPNAMYRRFGFETVGFMVERRISTDLTTELVGAVREAVV